MLLDTDVMVDFLRGHTPAVNWLTNYSLPIGIPGFVAMELLQGCRDLTEQQRVERELVRFAIFGLLGQTVTRPIASLRT
jgi:predicted nucleic acid-binding protein